MLYHTNDLREAVDMAKRMQMKDQIDKQKSGQSSVSPFMKIIGAMNMTTSLQNALMLRQMRNRMLFCNY